jgi:replication-associated recombination protein RarA
VVLDTRKCPESVKTTALQVVKIIEESECGSILIQGPPGVGKTYTARLFNSMNKNAMLCPDFNPLSGETPNSVYDDLGCQRDKLIVVLVINEVEEVIKKMGNKSEWNNLLDLVNNSPHMFKLIMTTNVPLEQLIKKDISLLRDGRVAKLELEVQDDMDVRVRMVSDADLLARSTPDEPDEPDEADEAAKPISRRRAFAKLIRAGFHRSR